MKPEVMSCCDRGVMWQSLEEVQEPGEADCPREKFFAYFRLEKYMPEPINNSVPGMSWT